MAGISLISHGSAHGPQVSHEVGGDDLGRIVERAIPTGL